VLHVTAWKHCAAGRQRPDEVFQPMKKAAHDTKVLQFHHAAANALDSFERNGFAADIFHNPQIDPPTWHFIVTRVQSAEILYWGQEPSLDRARDAANVLLGSLAAIAVG
jgi:hypothetical protein